MEYKIDESKKNDKQIEVLDFSKRYSNNTLTVLESRQSSVYMIISLDIETYKCEKTFIQKPYLVGFRKKNKIVLEYLNKEKIERGECIMLECLKKIIRPENRGYTVYVHNLGGFDSMFMTKILKRNFDGVDILIRDRKIFGYTVKVGGGLIKFKDSYRILPLSLNDLSKSFGLNDGKGI